MRVATWNAWARYGDWQERQRGIEADLGAAEPDLVLLTEAWAVGNDTQAATIAAGLECEYHHHHGSFDDVGVSSGVGIVSRWPIANMVAIHLPARWLVPHIGDIDRC